jgi:hypothetical protein
MIKHVGCLVALSAAVTVTGAETTPIPAPTPVVPAASTVPTPPLDPATVKRAEEAAEAYLKQANVRPDPLAETTLAEIEILLLEVQAFIDVKQSLKAGERYLAAIEKRKSIADDQRVLLSKRLQKVDASMLNLSRALLNEPSYNLGDPPADQPPANPDADPSAK